MNHVSDNVSTVGSVRFAALNDTCRQHEFFFKQNGRVGAILTLVGEIRQEVNGDHSFGRTCHCSQLKVSHCMKSAADEIEMTVITYLAWWYSTGYRFFQCSQLNKLKPCFPSLKQEESESTKTRANLGRASDFGLKAASIRTRP
jgi:hypothetical protein